MAPPRRSNRGSRTRRRDDLSEDEDAATGDARGQPSNISPAGDSVDIQLQMLESLNAIHLCLQQLVAKSSDQVCASSSVSVASSLSERGCGVSFFMEEYIKKFASCMWLYAPFFSETKMKIYLMEYFSDTSNPEVQDIQQKDLALYIEKNLKKFME